MHHELFHLLDHAMLGDAAYADHEWDALNPHGFAYRDPANLEADRPAGFVDSYATTNDLEDRASMFEYLMGRPNALCDIAKADPVVAKKTVVVWKRVTKVMSEQLLRQHAPCVDWIDQRAARPVAKPAKRTTSAPRAKSLIGKMR